MITANSHRAPGRAVAAHEIRVPAAQWYGLGEAGAGGCATERQGVRPRLHGLLLAELGAANLLDFSRARSTVTSGR